MSPNIAERIKFRVRSGTEGARSLVFIAGPYTASTPASVASNVRQGIDAFLALADAGLDPFLPHLFHFIEIGAVSPPLRPAPAPRPEVFAANPRPYELWTRIDKTILRRSDAVLRLPGESKGADAECEIARKLFIPVFDTVAAVITWARRAA